MPIRIPCRCIRSIHTPTLLPGAVSNRTRDVVGVTLKTIPSKPQGIYVGISKDGLTWDINETNLAPTNKSYLDPTGLLFPDSTDK